MSSGANHNRSIQRKKSNSMIPQLASSGNDASVCVSARMKSPSDTTNTAVCAVAFAAARIGGKKNSVPPLAVSVIRALKSAPGS
jgi:hypothetical protein